MCDLVKHCIDEFMHCFLGQVRRENGDRLLMVVLVVLLLVTHCGTVRAYTCRSAHLTGSLSQARVFKRHLTMANASACKTLKIKL